MTELVTPDQRRERASDALRVFHEIAAQFHIGEGDTLILSNIDLIDSLGELPPGANYAIKLVLININPAQWTLSSVAAFISEHIADLQPAEIPHADVEFVLHNGEPYLYAEVEMRF